MDDEDRAAYRKRRMAELLADADAYTARTRVARERAEAVVRSRRGQWLYSLLAVTMLLAVSFLLIGTAMTLARFTGPNFNDARRTGTATVEHCERHGPISINGFGYYEQCTVTIDWHGGPSARIVVHKPGFFRGERSGDTFEIGQNAGSRGSVGYSRPELPDRGWVTLIGSVIGLAGVLPLVAIYFYLRESIKDLFRRRR